MAKTHNASATTTIAPIGTVALLCQLDRGGKVLDQVATE